MRLWFQLWSCVDLELQRHVLDLIQKGLRILRKEGFSLAWVDGAGAPGERGLGEALAHCGGHCIGDSGGEVGAALEGDSLFDDIR